MIIGFSSSSSGGLAGGIPHPQIGKQCFFNIIKMELKNEGPRTPKTPSHLRRGWFRECEIYKLKYNPFPSLVGLL